MKTYSLHHTVALLQRDHWVTIRARDLFRLLQQHRIIRRTPAGYQLTAPAEHRGLLVDHTGQHTRTTETGHPIHAHNCSVRATPRGVQWLAELIVIHRQKAENAA